jgi:flagellar protein FlbD
VAGAGPTGVLRSETDSRVLIDCRVVRMIWLTRLNHNPFVLNAEQIAHLEVTPDTVIFLTDGQKIVVRETAENVINRVIDYRRTILQPCRLIQDGSQDT